MKLAGRVRNGCAPTDEPTAGIWPSRRPLRRTSHPNVARSNMADTIVGAGISPTPKNHPLWTTLKPQGGGLHLEVCIVFIDPAAHEISTSII